MSRYNSYIGLQVINRELHRLLKERQAAVKDAVQISLQSVYICWNGARKPQISGLECFSSLLHAMPCGQLTIISLLNTEASWKVMYSASLYIHCMT